MHHITLKGCIELLPRAEIALVGADGVALGGITEESAVPGLAISVDDSGAGGGGEDIDATTGDAGEDDALGTSPTRASQSVFDIKLFTDHDSMTIDKGMGIMFWKSDNDHDNIDHHDD